MNLSNNQKYLDLLLFQKESKEYFLKNYLLSSFGYIVAYL